MPALLVLQLALGDTQPAGAHIPPLADLSIVKSDSPDPVTAGGNLAYLLRVRNAGPDAATGVTLTDVIPLATTFVSLTQTSGPVFTCTTPLAGATGTVSCAKLSLAAGAVATFTLVVKVNAKTPSGTVITNTAAVAAVTLDLNAANNSDTETTTVNALATVDLSVTKTDSPDPVIAGTDLTYTITVANAGPGTAENVTLTDVVPIGTTFVSFTAPAGWSSTTPAAGAPGGSATVTATNPSFGAGGNAVFTLVVNVNARVPGGNTIINTATVSSSSSDANTANDSDTETTAVLAAADLSVTKTDSPDPVIAGTDLTYTITVANAGSSDAQSVTVTDVVPTNTTFVSVLQTSGPAFTCTPPAAGGTGTVNCSIATLAAGAVATFLLDVNVNASTPDRATITNSASVSAATSDPSTANNTDTETTSVNAPSADLTITKTDSPDPVTAGSNLTYTLSIGSLGPDAAQSLTLSDTVPAGTTFVSFTQTSGPDFTLSTPPPGGTGTVTATAASFAASDTATFDLVVNVNANTPQDSTITNSASVSAAASDPSTANNTDTETTTANASADLVVVQSDSPDPVTAGSNLSYTLTVGNAGPSDAQSVTLSDTLPAGTTFVSLLQTVGPDFTCSSPPAGGTGTVSCSIATLAAGASAAFFFVVNVDASTAHDAVITNTAVVGTSTSDPVAANNTDTETTKVNASADLVIVKSDSPDPVTAGSDVTYTLTVANAGPSDAQSVTLSDTVPAGTTFISFAQTVGPIFTCTTPAAGGMSTVGCSAVTVAAGASAAFLFVVNVIASTPAGATISNTATVGASTSDPDLANNSDTETTAVGASP